MVTPDTFFSQINYASFHEDGNSERRALKLRNADRVLCLTGSGARPLDLLLDDPAEIVALDWNPSQSYLLELKIAAIRELSYEAGLAFLGFTGCSNRLTTYQELRRTLSPDAQAFWDANQHALRDGVFFNGRWERFLRRVSWLARWTRRDLVRQLMESGTIAEQSLFWRNNWDNSAWRSFLAIATNRLVVRYILREPGLNLVPKNVAISQVIRQRFDQASRSFLFRDSPWVWALFKGRVEVEGPLPEHLQKKNFEFLRSRLDRIKIRTASLTTHLQQAEERFDAFSLSDFCSYCDQPTYDMIWKHLLHRSHPGARFCERRFLVEYALPEKIASAIDIDNVLAKQLEIDDRSVVYTFFVAATR